jgi:hypothetical protein
MSDEWVPVEQEVIGLSTRVAHEAGRYVVYLDVVLANGSVTHRVSDWPDEKRAKVAADIVERNAGRRIDPPTGF